jgi:hypothetical protein
MRGIRIHERIRLARRIGSAHHTLPAAGGKAARSRLTAVRVRAAFSRTARQQSMPARQKDRGNDSTLLRWVLLLLLLLRTFTSVTGSGTPEIQSSFRRLAEIGPGATCARCFGLSENYPQLVNVPRPRPGQAVAYPPKASLAPTRPARPAQARAGLLQDLRGLFVASPVDNDVREDEPRSPGAWRLSSRAHRPPESVPRPAVLPLPRLYGTTAQGCCADASIRQRSLDGAAALRDSKLERMLSSSEVWVPKRTCQEERRGRTS